MKTMGKTLLFLSSFSNNSAYFYHLQFSDKILTLPDTGHRPPLPDSYKMRVFTIEILCMCFYDPSKINDYVFIS